MQDCMAAVKQPRGPQGEIHKTKLAVHFLLTRAKPVDSICIACIILTTVFVHLVRAIGHGSVCGTWQLLRALRAAHLGRWCFSLPSTEDLTHNMQLICEKQALKLLKTICVVLGHRLPCEERGASKTHVFFCQLEHTVFQKT